MSMKIRRHCPRCRKHLYHFVNVKTKIAWCADCGHEWKIRWVDDAEKEDARVELEKRNREEE